MDIIEIDFHGFTIEEARDKIDKIINKTRMSGIARDYRFITGTGNLQAEIMEYLKKDYDIESSIDIGNHGVILVYVE